MRTWVGVLTLVTVFAGCAKRESPMPVQGRAVHAGHSDEVISAADPPDVRCDVVYLEKCPGLYMPLPPGPDRGLMVRELFRQALLIAARDELGMVTRDAWLGDAMPTDGETRPFDLAAQTDGRLQVLRGFSSSAKVISATNLPTITSSDFYLRRLWVDAETLSRTSLVEILRRALGPRQSPPWRPDLTVPEPIEESLQRMSFLAQFKAAREVHELMAAQGQSPALLGALIRAYANLGILTEFHWHPAHKVFKARAILYAQRWLVREPDSLPAKWHRAYALTLAGSHADALEDLDSAQKTWQATAEKQRPVRPGWVALLDAYCHYDIDQLAASREDKQHGALAAMLQYHGVELAGNRRWPLQVAVPTLEKIPDCFRIHDGVCIFGGVSTNHVATLAPIEVLGRTLYDEVQRMPGLPESVREQTQRRAAGQAASDFDAESMATEFQARVGLVTALREASEPLGTPKARAKSDPNDEPGDWPSNSAASEALPHPADMGEPSWAALAQMIQEVSFVHVWRRASFERYALSVPTEEFLTLAAPLVANHPLLPFLDTLAWDVAKQREAMERCAQLAPDGLELHAGPILGSFGHFGEQNASSILASMQEHRDLLARDFVVVGRLVDDDPKQLARCAKSLLRISPYSPLARTWLVDAEAASKTEIAEWEKSADKYPGLASGLARYYSKAEQWDDAARCCQAAIKVVEDKAIYEFLAEVYAKKGDEDHWLETLEGALRLPDYGLDHAQIQSKIAWHFMGKKEWTRALPHAKAAADCYSGWGLLCAAACYEGLHEWEKAEQYVQATADRYRSSALEWYFFCRRTGRGHLSAARELARTYVEDPSAQDSRDARCDVATFYVLEGQRDQALAIYREVLAELADPFFGLWVAILADEIHDHGVRDAALAQVRLDSPSLVRKEIGRVRKELIALAGLIERDLAQGRNGRIDLKAAEEVRATIEDPYELGYFELFLARYLQGHGMRDEAIHYWKERVASTDGSTYCRTLAGATLLELGQTAEGETVIPERGEDAN